MLAPITDRFGTTRPLIYWSWLNAKKVRKADRVIVATDSARIHSVATAFGAEAMMTSESCRNGTERCVEVLRRIDEEHPQDLIVNMQGDAPLLSSVNVDRLIESTIDSKYSVFTLVATRTTQLIAGDVSCVMSNAQRAVYFSRASLPFSKRQDRSWQQHMGAYVYRPAALRRYEAYSMGLLEMEEDLEQLRWIENGIAVKCEFAQDVRQMPEVNYPEDIKRVGQLL